VHLYGAGLMFPHPAPVATRPCARCGIRTRVDRLVAGRYGSDCAAQLGLTGRTTDTTQDGPDLLDLLNGDPHDEPDDCCDGGDRDAALAARQPSAPQPVRR
jgi:hypothetical protein